MNYKHSCVVDADGSYKDFVLVTLKSDIEGAVQPVVQHYTLAEGERLVDAPPPATRTHAGEVGLVSSRWDGAGWVEAATPAEVAAWEAAHPAPELATAPTMEQRTTALEGAVLALLGGDGNA